jgi:paired amphipathic helix protein Sin3a
MNIVGGDVKDKSLDIARLFFKDRSLPDTSRKQEIQYRKQVEKLSRDGEVYRISYVSLVKFVITEINPLTYLQVPEEQRCTIRLFPGDDATFDSEHLTTEGRWQYYIASYSMNEPTEGVDLTRLRPSFLRRNVAPQNARIEAAYAEIFGNLESFDEQALRISPNSYKLIITDDFGWIRHNPASSSGKSYEVGRIEESAKFRENFVRNNAWMRNASAEFVEARKALWEGALRHGVWQSSND